MNVKASPKLHYGWAVVLASMLGLSVGVQGVTSYTAGVFFMPLSDEFGWSLQQISVAFLILNHAIVVVAPFSGRMIDHKSNRVLISVSTALAGAGFVSLYFLSGSLFHFYITFAVIAVMGCFSTPMAYSKLISRWFEKRLGLALGFMMSGVGLGSAFLPAFALFLIQNHGWRAGYVGLGLAMICVAPLLALILRDNPRLKNLDVDGKPLIGEPETETSERQPAVVFQETGMSTGEALKSATFWWLLIAFVMISLGFASLIVPMATLLSLHGLDGTQIGLALAGLGTASFITRLVFGWLIDHVDPIILAILIWIPVACCILLLGQAQAPWVLMVIPVAIGIALGSELDLLAFLTRRYFGLRSMGVLYSILSASFILSASWGTVAVARLLDMGAVETVVKSLFGLIVAGCLTLLWVRKTGQYAR